MKKKFKKKKSIFKNEFFWSVILSFLIIVGFFYFFIFSEFFQVERIIIKNGKKILSFRTQIQELIEEKIKRNLFFFETKTIFLINFDEINKILLKRFPLIEKIEFRKEFPNVIKTKITEREPVAFFVTSFEEEKENYFFIDKKGVIFERIKEKDIKKEIIEIKNQILNLETKLGTKVITEKNIEKILEIKDRAKNKLNLILEKVVLVSEKRLNFKTSEGWEIYFDIEKNSELALAKLDLLLEKGLTEKERKNLQYIDLRFTKVYYK